MSLDVEKAKRDVWRATIALASIAALPPQIGARVIWTNGVIWTRVGEDAWTPDEGYQPGETAPSSHVASSEAWQLAPDQSSLVSRVQAGGHA